MGADHLLGISQWHASASIDLGKQPILNKNQPQHHVMYLSNYISGFNFGKRHCHARDALSTMCCACAPTCHASIAVGKSYYASGLVLCNMGDFMGFAKHYVGIPMKNKRVTRDFYAN